MTRDLPPSLPPESEPGDPQDSERSRAQSSGRTWSKPQVRRVMLTGTRGTADSTPGSLEDTGLGYRLAS